MNFNFHLNILNAATCLHSNSYVNDNIRGEQLVCQKFIRIIPLILVFVLLAMSGFAQPQNGDYRSIHSGNWDSPTTWQRFDGTQWIELNSQEEYPGKKPGTGNVTIKDGNTVSINISPSYPIKSLFVGGATSGILQYDDLTARTLTIREIVTINPNGVIRSADPSSGSTIKSHIFVVQGSIINNGTIDFCLNSSGTVIKFTGAGGGNSTFNCQSATAHTNLLESTGLSLEMGDASSVLLFYPGSDFKVESTTTKGFLKITKGIFRIPSGTITFVNPIFNVANYVIPKDGGFELSNSKTTVTAQSGSVDNQGLIRITAGTYNIGTASGNSLLTHMGGTFELSGGIVNVAGRFALSEATGNLNGGTLNLSILGNESPEKATFDCDRTSILNISKTSLISFTIPNSKGFNDAIIRSGTGTKSITGGIFQMGTAKTPTGSTFAVNSDITLNKLTAFDECTIRIIKTSGDPISNAVNSTISDSIAPALTAPESITVKCDGAIPVSYPTLTAFINGGGKASKICTFIPSSFKLAGQIQSGSSCPYTITRTYQVTDIFGSVGIAKHLILVEDAAIQPQTVAVAEPAKEEVLKLKSAMATFVSTAAGGDWNVGSTWVGGVVPGVGDDVVIASGATVTTNNVTINASLSLQSGATLEVTGDWTNNGTFNAGTGTVEFGGIANASISGTSSNTFNNLILNKGTSISTQLSIGSDVTINNLTFTNGVIKTTSGTTTINDIVNANNAIPSTAGFIVDGGILNTGYFPIDNEGLIQVNTGGTANFGTGSGNEVHTQINGAFIVTGGTVNIAGRLENTAGGTLVPGINSGITISNGTINLSTQGNGASGDASLMVSAQGAFRFTGGNINFQNANSNPTDPIDLALTLQSGLGVKTITNGIFNFGNGTSTTFRISSEIPLPNITAAANTTLALLSDIVITNNLSLDSSSKLILDENSIQIPVSANGVKNFPLVNASGDAMPISIDITGDSFTNANIVVESKSTYHPQNNHDADYLNRYWKITTTGISNPTFAINAAYLATDIVGTPTNLVAASYSGSTWTQISGATIAGNNITFSGSGTSIEFTALDAPTITITNGDAVTICSGANLDLTTTTTADPVASYSWSSNPSGFTGSFANVTVTPNVTTIYTVIVTDENDLTATDNITVTVDAASVGGSLAGATTVCSGTNSTLLTLSGYTGTIEKWQSSIDAGNNWTDISNSVNTYTATNLTTSTEYRVLVKSGVCSESESQIAQITVNPLPTIYNVTGGGDYCSGGSGVTIGLSNSQTGVNYQLYNGASSVGSVVAGTGSVISFGLQTAAGNYTIKATNETTSCVQNMIGNAIVSVNPLPTAYNVTGSGAYCSGGSGVSVGLSNSQSGVNYQLYYGVTPVGAVVAGTGAAITFGFQTAAGNYTVKATNATTSCVQNMTGSATVTINPLPTLYNVTGGGDLCSGGSGVPIGLDNSQSGVNYRLYKDASPVGSIVAGTGSAISFGLQTAGGSYTVRATNTTTTCVQIMSGSVTVTVNPLPSAYTVTGGGGYCSGGSGISVGLGFSQLGVNYQLYNGASPVGSLVAGTGSSISFGLQTAAGTYTVKATNATTSCVRNMTGSVTVTVNPTPSVLVSNPPTVCAPATVDITDPTWIAGSTLADGIPDYWTDAAATIHPVSPGSISVPGTYYITATTAFGCTSDIQPIVVSINPQPTTPSITGLSVVCNGSTISLSTTAVDPIVWNSSNPAVATINPSTGVVSGVSAGTTNITYLATNANNCTSISSNFQVTVVQMPTVNLTTPAPVCSPSTINLTATILPSSTPGLTYTYWKDLAQTISYTTPATATNGIYYIKGTVPGTGCYDIKQVTATVNITPVLTNASPDTICNGTSTAITFTAADGAVLIPTTSWGKGSVWPTPPPNVIMNPQSGSGLGINQILTNSGTSPGYVIYNVRPRTATCTSPITFPIKVWVNPPLRITDQPTNPKYVCGESTVDFTAYAIGVPTPTVQWEESTDNGSTWTTLVNGGNVSGATDNLLTITNPVNNILYRAIFSNECETDTTHTSRLFVSSGQLNYQELTQTDGCGDGQYTFASQVTGDKDITGIMQMYDGEFWVDIPGSEMGPINDTLNFVYTIVYGQYPNGTQFRARFKGLNCNTPNLITNTATYTPIGITTYSVCLGAGPTQFTQTGTPGGIWSVYDKDGLAVPGIMTSTGVFTPTAASYGHLYTKYVVGSCESIEELTIFPIAPVYKPIPNTCTFLKLPEPPDYPATIRYNDKIFEIRYSVVTPEGVFSDWISDEKLNLFLADPNNIMPGCYTFVAHYKAGEGEPYIGAWGETGKGDESTDPLCQNGPAMYAVIFPKAPVLVAPPNTCNTKLDNITAVAVVDGFTAEYAVQSPTGTLSAYGTLAQANALLTNTPGGWTIKARYKLTEDCGTNLANTPSPCAASTAYAVVYPAPPPTPTVSADCGAFTITPPASVLGVPGFNIEYSFDNGASWGGNTLQTADNCAYILKTRYVLSTNWGTTAAGPSPFAGCSESPAFTRTIDTTAPVLNCNNPGNQVKDATNGTTYIHSGTGWNATATDACGPPVVTVSLSGATTANNLTTLNGVAFNEGVTTVTWKATDACSNTSACPWFTVTVNASADLAIVKTASPDPAVAGQPLTYTITVTNNGPGGAQNVSISDNISAFPSPQVATNLADPWVAWNSPYSLGTLANGASSTIYIRGTVNIDECDQVTNIATVASTTRDDVPGNNNSGIITTIVSDQTKPEITCPTQPAAFCATNAVGYTHPDASLDATATDNCTENPIIIYLLTGDTTGTGSTLEGVTFNSGTTTVKWRATDAAGNYEECSFNVTIHPLPAPSAIYHN